MSFEGNFFDIWNIFVNEVIGDVFLFLMVGLILVVLYTLTRNMSFQISLMFACLWVLIIFAATLNPAYYVLVILYIGVTYYSSLSRALKRS